MWWLEESGTAWTPPHSAHIGHLPQSTGPHDKWAVFSWSLALGSRAHFHWGRIHLRHVTLRANEREFWTGVQLNHLRVFFPQFSLTRPQMKIRPRWPWCSSGLNEIRPWQGPMRANFILKGRIKPFEGEMSLGQWQGLIRWEKVIWGRIFKDVNFNHDWTNHDWIHREGQSFLCGSIS